MSEQKNDIDVKKTCLADNLLPCPSTLRTIPLVEVVDAFEVFCTNQGAQGIMRPPSKQHLDSVFGTTKVEDVIVEILEKGEMQAGSEFAREEGGSVHHVVKLITLFPFPF